MIIGMLSISAGTFMNGFKQNNIHIHHHVIRLIVETGITIICWIGREKNLCKVVIHYAPVNAWRDRSRRRRGS